VKPTTPHTNPDGVFTQPRHVLKSTRPTQYIHDYTPAGILSAFCKSLFHSATLLSHVTHLIAYIAGLSRKPQFGTFYLIIGACMPDLNTITPTSVYAKVTGIRQVRFQVHGYCLLARCKL
jgi:hypothetical protein